MLVILGLFVFLLAAAPARAEDALDRVISFTTREAEIRDILQAIARLANINIIIDPKIRGKMAFTVKEVTVAQALYLVSGITGNRMANIKGVWVVGPEETIKFMLGPGRTELVRLRYAKCEEIANIVNKVYQKDATAQHHAPTNTVIVAPK